MNKRTLLLYIVFLMALALYSTSRDEAVNELCVLSVSGEGGKKAIVSSLSWACHFGRIAQDNLVVRCFGNEDVGFADIPAVVLENSTLRFSLDANVGLFAVLDKRSNKLWQANTDLSFKDIVVEGLSSLSAVLVDSKKGKNYSLFVKMASDRPELVFNISQAEEFMFESLDFPPFFRLSDDAQLVLPFCQGFLITKNEFFKDFSDFSYGGQWSIPFVGVIDGSSSFIESVKTPYDFKMVLVKNVEPRELINRWIPEKGKFGYTREIKFFFLNSSSYVDMAKEYRKNSIDFSYLLKEKASNRKEKLGRMAGAVDMWYWGSNALEFLDELFYSGIQKCLFSNALSNEVVTKANSIGYLSSRYDIYQDVWPPIFREVTNVHEGWPDDLVLDGDGNWIKGWAIRKGLREYVGGVVCSVPALRRAKNRISQELKRKFYTARFIDTVTSSSWKECYNYSHPTTRTVDMIQKMKLLRFCSYDLGLVTGSEDGVECAVPFVDYLEGCMSPGIGRLPGAGRNVAKVEYVKPNEQVLKYGVNEKVRIPLWQLIYGDYVVSTWYWGDSNNRIPELWWRKDLFNILYGTMPLWAIRDYNHWVKLKQRFLESYLNVCPVFEKVCFSEMENHSFLTKDRSVQETSFKGDIKIFVNFSEKNNFELKEFNYLLAPRSFVVFDNGKIWRAGECS